MVNVLGDHLAVRLIHDFRQSHFQQGMRSDTSHQTQNHRATAKRQTCGELSQTTVRLSLNGNVVSNSDTLHLELCKGRAYGEAITGEDQRHA